MADSGSIALYVGAGAHPGSAARTGQALSGGPWGAPVALGAEGFRPAELRRHALVILPGGRANAICRDLGPMGRDALRCYASEGGAVLGICAGMYALALPFAWALHMLPVTIVDPPHWQRGRARTQITLTDGGRASFGTEHRALRVAFRDGPVVAADGTGRPYDVLATYDEDLVHPQGSPGLMVGSPAALRAPYGSGAVLGIGPHLEDGEEHRPLLLNFVAHLLRASRAAPGQPAGLAG